MINHHGNSSSDCGAGRPDGASPTLPRGNEVMRTHGPEVQTEEHELPIITITIRTWLLVILLVVSAIYSQAKQITVSSVESYATEWRFTRTSTSDVYVIICPAYGQQTLTVPDDAYSFGGVYNAETGSGILGGGGGGLFADTEKSFIAYNSHVGFDVKEINPVGTASGGGGGGSAEPDTNLTDLMVLTAKFMATGVVCSGLVFASRYLWSFLRKFIGGSAFAE